MKLYTTAGDDGYTHLVDGRRVPKDDLRVRAYGRVDELNCWLGFCRVVPMDEELAGRIEQLQQELFVVGAELATPPDARKALQIKVVEVSQIERLEGWIDQAVDAVDPLAHFVLPGGSELAARFHLTRTCCRNLEREVVALMHESEVRGELLKYVNRLGDLMFAWARLANHRASTPEHIWKAQK